MVPVMVSMVKVWVATALLMPPATAIALRFSELGTLTGAVYSIDAVVGVEPLRV
jgi:hypothetical protein